MRLLGGLPKLVVMNNLSRPAFVESPPASQPDEQLDARSPLLEGLRWLNRFASLGPAHAVPCMAEPFPDGRLVAVSARLARELGLDPDDLQTAGHWAAWVGQRRWPEMAPVATAYSGHQFGFWAGQLGDGRALLLGEIDTPSGSREIQVKGAGRTPFSRRGDGRAVLRSSIREFLCSEAMHALGIPTTRALCLATSPLPVWRETVESAAIVTRVAPSFVRFGHFEHHAFQMRDPAALKTLADHLIDAHLPHCAEESDRYAALLREVAVRTGELLARWQAVGFCHGVMNTDNMSMLGLTLDYGPFGFMDAYDPGHVCNHSDDGGRYAYDKQPQVAWWNLHVLAQAMQPLCAQPEAAQEAIEHFKSSFGQSMLAAWRDKLGLTDMTDDAPAVVDDLFRMMAANRVDYTIFFRRLAGFSTAPAAKNEEVRDLFFDRPAFDDWAARYTRLLQHQGGDDVERGLRMKRVNPRIVLRNHLAELAIQRAEAGDFTEVHRLLAALEHPYDDHPGSDPYAGFPPDWASSLEVSCSS